MECKHKKEISRRDFLKTMGVAGAASAGLSACSNNDNTTAAALEIPKGQMTYRQNPKNGDKVSLLGFGMMRLPSVIGKSARETSEIDQEMVNRMVDYAIEHGVNYFDTSPAYCQGFSERATGIALSRHPRESYYVATKLSNFAQSTWSREASMAMYEKSRKELQVDYIDYMLLHSIGGGKDAMAQYNARYVDNGMLDFLLKEREAGRIRNLGFSYHGDIKVFDYLLSRHDELKWDFVQIQQDAVLRIYGIQGCDNLAHIRYGGAGAVQLDNFAIGQFGGNLGDGCFSGAGRTVKNQVRQLTGFQNIAQRLIFAD